MRSSVITILCSPNIFASPNIFYKVYASASMASCDRSLIVISKFLERHSKAKRRAPAYSRALLIHERCDETEGLSKG